MQMKLDRDKSQFQIAKERLESATKKESKLAEILQAKGEVETSNATIETLTAEIFQVD